MPDILTNGSPNINDSINSEGATENSEGNSNDVPSDESSNAGNNGNNNSCVCASDGCYGNCDHPDDDKYSDKIDPDFNDWVNAYTVKKNIAGGLCGTWYKFEYNS